jgi:uncharacterized protein
MIFDIEHIDDEGLDFDIIRPKERFNIDSPDCVLAEGVKVQGTLERTGLEILCKGILETGLSVTCTRCLSDFSYVVNSELKVHFIPRTDNNKLAHEIELTELDVEQEFYEEGRIDLSSPARDLILLSLPQVILCRKDCSGLCPECGTNLNMDKCDCKKEESYDPRLAVLQQLKDKLK